MHAAFLLYKLPQQAWFFAGQQEYLEAFTTAHLGQQMCGTSRIPSAWRKSGRLQLNHEVLCKRTEMHLSITLAELQKAMVTPETTDFFSDPVYIAGSGVKFRVSLAKPNEAGQRKLQLFIDGCELELPGAPGFTVPHKVLQLQSYKLYKLASAEWQVVHSHCTPINIVAGRGYGCKKLMAVSTLSDLEVDLVDGCLWFKAEVAATLNDKDSRRW
jgi:hypothetical protein